MVASGKPIYHLANKKKIKAKHCVFVMKNSIFVAKICKYGSFVAKIYKYALIDSFQGYAGFLDSSTYYAALCYPKIPLNSA